MKVKDLLSTCMNYDEAKTPLMLKNPATGRWKSYDTFADIGPKVLNIEIEYFEVTKQYGMLVAFTSNDTF